MAHLTIQQRFENQRGLDTQDQRQVCSSVALLGEHYGMYHHLANTDDHPGICRFIPGYAFCYFLGRRLAEQLMNLLY